MTTTTTERPQPLVALDKAQRHRQARAELKRWLFSAPTTTLSRGACADLLLEDARDELKTMRVVELLAACRGTGPVRAKVMMRRAGVSDRKVIEELDVDQALAIVKQLEIIS